MYVSHRASSYLYEKLLLLHDVRARTIISHRNAHIICKDIKREENATLANLSLKNIGTTEMENRVKSSMELEGIRYMARPVKLPIHNTSEPMRSGITFRYMILHPANSSDREKNEA